MKTNIFLVFALILVLLASCKKVDPDPPMGLTEPTLLTCGDLDQTVTLRNDPNKPIDYIVDCLMFVEAAITIEAGTVIQFDDGVGFMVRGAGSIRAIGSQDALIVFTSRTKQKGAWRGLYIESSSINNVFEHCRIEYGGGDSFNSNDNKGAIVVWAGSRLKLDNVIISDSENYGISMEYGDTNFQMTNSTITDTDGGPIITIARNATSLGSGNSFTGNSEDWITVLSGFFSPNATLGKLDVPYRFDVSTFPFEMIVESGVLTIEPGVQIEMEPSATLKVDANGSLKIIGSSLDPVVITGAVKSPGSWSGIYYVFTTNINNVIEHALIAHAGDGSEAGRGAISLWANPRLRVSNVHFENLPNCAIFNHAGATNPNLTLENNTLTEVAGEELCWE